MLSVAALTPFVFSPNVTVAICLLTEAFVWAWLPGASEPVAAGRLETSGEIVYFTYGRSYLDRFGAIPLYLPELPLRQGRIRPPAGLTAAGCIRDAGPDAWGSGSSCSDAAGT